MESPSQKQKAIETEDLIQLVRQRPCLWDRAHPGHRDKAKKESAWNEIYRIIEPDYDHFSENLKNLIGMQITRKWYNVRDSYVKSKKQNLRVKPYLHSKLLTFLEPVYFEKNYTRREALKSQEENEQEEWLNEVFVVEGEDTQDAKRPKLDYNHKPHESIEGEDSIIHVLTNILSREEDEDRAFFKSITPAVKRLSEESKFEFRMQVMNVLKNLLSKEKNVVNMKCEGVGGSDED